MPGGTSQEPSWGSGPYCQSEMSIQPTKIRTSLVKIQKHRVKFYLDASEQFTTNSLVHEKWVEIANDLEAQGAGLKSLPRSLWLLVGNEDGTSLLATMEQAIKAAAVKTDGEVSLRQYITSTLNLEEPVVLGIYAPLVRILRANWTDRALDFYVMARSHLTRLVRLVKPFCGDPTLIHRATSLVERFEQEVQQPQIVIKPKAAHKARKSVTGRSSKPAGKKKQAGARAKAKKKPAAESRRVLAARRRPSKRVKPVVRDMKMGRRSARR